jgi:hypothetical protein
VRDLLCFSSIHPSCAHRRPRALPIADDAFLPVVADCDGRGRTLGPRRLPVRARRGPIGKLNVDLGRERTPVLDKDTRCSLLLGRSIRACPSIRLFHIADDGPSTIVHMDVLDADKLLAAIA